ncbi:hypothetical protein Pla22_44450 [Rubripirellula amarantea]|uniref:Periplasmic folding chaperone n=1 Tax=Rubripirellula amarantea TaxID=2527999 RepID=A0A5C5WHI0_9BACT|nr:hypothetical protein [Rubripirellula amarantea]TWT49252.1 hypothetical protein Pla22_44450 [Rubripirellula amarantea]
MNTSPFEIFRRNLKPLMVFLTLLALLSFVVLPVVQTYLQQSGGMGGGGNSVVAKFNGAELTRSRVDYFTRNHQSTVRFLNDLAEETIAKGGVPRTAGFQYNAQQKQIQSLGINENPSTEGTVRTFMFASQASKEGFALDDSSLSRWLERFTDGMFSDGEITSKLMQSTRNEMGRPHLYEQLRNHLLADVYLRRGNVALVSSTGALLTPDEQWRNFLKMNQNATADAYGILVNDYIEKTNASPSETRIREVYEEGKNRDPNEQSPEPAFHRQYEAAFEYVVGDYQEFLTAAIANVTEEEIKAEYERRLKGGDFKLPDDPASDDGELSLEADENEADEEAEMTEVEVTEPDNGEVKTDAEPKAETPSAESTEPAAESTEPAAENTEPAAESTEPTTESTEPAGDDQSRSNSNSAIRLVMFQDDDAPAGETSGDEPVADEETDAASNDTAKEEAPAEEMKQETPSEQEADAEAAPEDEPKADDEPKPDEPMEETEPEAAPTENEEAPAEEENAEESKIQSLEEVREKIAEDLAGPAARQAMDEAVTKVSKEMKNYFRRQAIHQSNVSIGQAGEEPVRPDLKALAAELNMNYEVIGPYSQSTITDEPIAESFEVGTQFGRRGPSFAIMMFGFDNGQNQLAPQPLFSSVRTADDERGKIYVSWKTSETEAYTPTLDEVRDEVVDAIRTEEARELAKAAAEELAAKAAEGTSLADLVPEDKKDNFYQDLGPFSWLNMIGIGQVTIGNVPELDSVGNDFMRATFTTDLGKLGVATNQPERVVYVVQPTKFEPSTEELQAQFKQPINRIMSRMVAGDTNEIIRGYYDSIDEQAGFEEFIDE